MRKRRSPTGEDIITTRPRGRNLQTRTTKPLANASTKRTRSLPAVSQPSPMLDKEDHLGWQEPLSVWNQNAPRVYICVVLCFPCDNQRRTDAIRHIESALKRLARERPVFAGRLQASSNSGNVSLHRSPSQDIPFQVLPASETSRQEYSRMKEAEFPPGTFVGPRFGASGIVSSNLESVPVSKVQAEFPPGGLLLSIFLHHGLVDGGSLRVFLECFAAQTRNTLVNLPSEQTFPMLHNRNQKGPITIHNNSSTFKSLLSQCPEYTMLKDLSGPTQPRILKIGPPMANIEKTGKIFVFRNERLQELRELIRSRNGGVESPSAYTSLAALAFAHITKARVAAENNLPGVQPRRTAMLWNSVNWRTRAFKDVTDNYFGNAALPVVTKALMSHVIAACDDDNQLARLVPLVKTSIDAVDQEYVNRRLAMLCEVPDPRLVGVNYDPRIPGALAFNTWRHFGADVQWNIPGVPVTRADAIRRAHGSWSLGTALILPAKADSMKQELFVSLPVDSMRMLCADAGWMRWVDRIIG
ncbi:uncharacterized protein F4812DRAFT_450955 [Daldinia caldariorum]|uniref:uncharacterized protein n=1 Tax=Daldinia caldariorum TaxID=326644 RepID=UPI002008AF76|nr:uncharacterized protein F4812DRAFT_450955 [Daldinia caldariorum]KAI1468344.1 hypothetical protein F4812DRAFT_450955 [Daldinia caldariorum]